MPTIRKRLCLVMFSILFVMGYCPALAVADGGVLQGAELDDAINSQSSNVSFVSFSKVDISERLGAAVSENGDLYLWGKGADRRAGIGDGKSSVDPVRVLSGVADVSISVSYASGDVIVVTEGGELWKLGDSDVADSVRICDGVKKAVCHAGICTILKKDGTVWRNEKRNDFSKLGKIGSDAIDVALSPENCAYVSKDGRLFMWGSNEHGQLLGALPESESSSSPVLVMSGVAKVSFLHDMSNAGIAVLKKDGTLWTWGQNIQGHLGNGLDNWDYTTEPSCILSDVADVTMCEEGGAAIKTDGTLWLWGDIAGDTRNMAEGHSFKPTKVLDSVKAVSMADTTIAAIALDGRLLTWGWSGYGILGNSQYHSMFDPPTVVLRDARSVDAILELGLAVKLDGTLWVWGAAPSRNDISTYSLPREVDEHVISAVGMYGGSDYCASDCACVLYVTQDGILNRWYSEPQFSIYEGSYSTEKLASGVKSVSGGMWGYYSIVTKDGRLLVPADCVPKEIASQGKYPKVNSEGKVYYQLLSNVDISASGNKYGAAVKTDGTLWTWGYNQFGCLGIGVEYDGKWHEPSMILDNVKSVSLARAGTCLYNSSIAVKNDGTVWAWGYDCHGMDSTGQLSPKQVGEGAKAADAMSYGYMGFVTSEDDLYENYADWESGHTFDKFEKTYGATAAIAYGYNFSVRLGSDGRVWTCGKSNLKGQLGSGKTSLCEAPAVIEVLATAESIRDIGSLVEEREDEKQKELDARRKVIDDAIAKWRASGDDAAKDTADSALIDGRSQDGTGAAGQDDAGTADVPGGVGSEVSSSANNQADFDSVKHESTGNVGDKAACSMHRLYNPYTGEHFYTSDDAERDGLVELGWEGEGDGWTAPEWSNTPVFRMYNPYAGEHHYCMTAEERDGLVDAGWIDEGIGWYSDDEQRTPLYREYNPYMFSCNHNYTTDAAEHEFLVSIGWVDEGYAWYGV